MSEPDYEPSDPLYRLAPAFLEEVSGPDALEWAKNQNAAAHEALGRVQLDGSPAVEVLEEELLDILDSPDRLPVARVRGDWAYNFWTDADNPRGLWRRQPVDSYIEGADAWEVLIDVDALAATEGKSWVWHGANVLRPDFDLALVALSDGGTDADETREFDIETRQFVENGFFRPEGKGSLSWLDRDTCWLTQPTDEQDTSPSGYPLQAKILRRGQTLDEAQLVFAAAQEDMGVWVGRLWDQTEPQSAIRVMEDFYNSSTHLVRGLSPTESVSPERIPAPSTAEVAVWNSWVLVWLREDWQRAVDGQTSVHPAGSLLAFKTEDLLDDSESACASVLFTPTATEVLLDFTGTASKVVLTTIDDVKTKLWALTPAEEAPKDGEAQPWLTLPFPALGSGEHSQFMSANVTAYDPVDSNKVWVVTSGYTEPSTLWLADLGEGDQPARLVRQTERLFDSSNVVVSQHFAVSADGTRVPYFEVRQEAAALPAPTLLYGYGGFNISLLPTYNPAVGKAWLERGGVYVVANIRGGGEYGPTWHTRALKGNRHLAYEDFVAVARDLVARGVTTTTQLGAQGGSNGGLLAGNMYTRYPDDFGAIVIQVPLLDMGRYHTLLAGHSWIAEYGDPRAPEQWQFIETFSPLHQFDPGRQYPPVFLTTSTKDDRVHPYHARAFAHLAGTAGKDVLYYENVEGGHAGAADNRQRAHNLALGWAFLWDRLG